MMTQEQNDSRKRKPKVGIFAILMVGTIAVLVAGLLLGSQQEGAVGLCPGRHKVDGAKPATGLRWCWLLLAGVTKWARLLKYTLSFVI